MDQALADAWGEFLGGHEWDWFCTFTFGQRSWQHTRHTKGSSALGHPMRTYSTLEFRGHEAAETIQSFTAHHQFDQFMREVCKAAGRPIAWFRADEIGLLGRF